MWILGLNGLIGSFSIDEGESTVFFENTVESLLTTWFFKTADFFFKSKVVSLWFSSVRHCYFTPDSSNPQFFETLIFWTNSVSFQKFTFDFSKSLKIQEPTKTCSATCTTVQMSHFWKSHQEATERCYTVKNHLRFCREEFPCWKDELISCYFRWVKKEKFWSRRLSCQSKGPASPGIFYLKNTICKEMPSRVTGQY